DNASIYYDREQHIGHVRYYGKITPQITVDSYGFVAMTMAKYIKEIRGGIYDFRHVTHFENANLATIQRTSTSLNTTFDMSHIALALVVGTLIQERLILVSMKVTPTEKRKRIVHSYQDAFAFIEEFHAQRVGEGGG